MAYSRDLRNKIIEAVEQGASQAEAARRFGVRWQTVGDYVKRYRERGEVYCKKHGGHRVSRPAPCPVTNEIAWACRRLGSLKWRNLSLTAGPLFPLSPGRAGEIPEGAWQSGKAHRQPRASIPALILPEIARRII